MKNNIAKAIRIITLAPVTGLVLFTILYKVRPQFFSGIHDYIFAILFITVFPISAYPLQKFIPRYKEAGRKGQRNLAIITANLGYLFGIITVLLTDAGSEILIIFLTYLLSGALIIVFNKFLKIRASGHACGTAGPIATLICYAGLRAVSGLSVLFAVYWSSLVMKRHTWSELIIGTMIPVSSLISSILIIGLL